MSRVYFAQPENGGQIKIGTSSNVKMRMQSLSTWVPGGIQLITDIPGGRVRESALKAIFSPWVVKGEWFQSCVEIWSVIIEAAQKGDLPWLPEEAHIESEAVIRPFGSAKAAALALETNLSDFSYGKVYASPALAGKFVAYQLKVRHQLPPFLWRGRSDALIARAA